MKLAQSTLATVLAATLLLAAAADVSARERTRSGAWDNGRGAGTWSQTVTREPGQIQKRGSWTNETRGLAGSRATDVTRDREAGTASKAIRVERSDGRGYAVDQTTTRGAPGAFDQTRTITTNSGKTATKTRSVTLDRD